MLPKPKNGEPRGLPNVFEQPSLQDLALSIPNQQAKACKRGCKTLAKVVKDFYASIETFPTNK